MKTAFTQCDRCASPIQYGEKYIAFVRHVEHCTAPTDTGAEAIDMDDAEQVLTLCGKCGEGFGHTAAKAFLQSAAAAMHGSFQN